jgi:hypothetical protein
MKLTAQRVTQPATGVHAIHAFYFTHQSYFWVGPPPPELGHGLLTDSHVPLGAGGNHVLTYLDIITPDETPAATILRVFAQLYDQHPPPFRTQIGNCTFESSMISAFASVWRAELAQLYDAAIAIRNRFHRVA